MDGIRPNNTPDGFAASNLLFFRENKYWTVLLFLSKPLFLLWCDLNVILLDLESVRLDFYPIELLRTAGTVVCGRSL